MIKLGIFADENYIGPFGLRCMDCLIEIEPGMEVGERLLGMVENTTIVEIICGACGRKEAEG